ncbi:hypothetical protein B484DRAFT_482326 [Ochromonadaceae sp. CCMP2298]|nr:hypothetical protein B484DRAFT_482326 [Ochromonadaceae sp. CCMP2298]
MFVAIRTMPRRLRLLVVLVLVCWSSWHCCSGNDPGGSWQVLSDSELAADVFARAYSWRGPTNGDLYDLSSFSAPHNASSSSGENPVCRALTMRDNCFAHNPARAEELLRRKWRANPSRRSVNLEPQAVLAGLRGEVVYLVGDSTVASAFASLVCYLHGKDTPARMKLTWNLLGTNTLLSEKTWDPPSACPADPRCHLMGGVAQFPLYNVTLAYVQLNTMQERRAVAQLYSVAGPQSHLFRGTHGGKATGGTDLGSDAYSSASLLVLGLGAHYSGERALWQGLSFLRDRLLDWRREAQAEVQAQAQAQAEAAAAKAEIGAEAGMGAEAGATVRGEVRERLVLGSGPVWFFIESPPQHFYSSNPHNGYYAYKEDTDKINSIREARGMGMGPNNTAAAAAAAAGNKGPSGASGARDWSPFLACSAAPTFRGSLEQFRERDWRNRLPEDFIREGRIIRIHDALQSQWDSHVDYMDSRQVQTQAETQAQTQLMQTRETGPTHVRMSPMPLPPNRDCTHYCLGSGAMRGTVTQLLESLLQGAEVSRRGRGAAHQLAQWNNQPKGKQLRPPQPADLTYFLKPLAKKAPTLPKESTYPQRKHTHQQSIGHRAQSNPM